jgi:predicted Holliday junction resolvase-like endonuclease
MPKPSLDLQITDLLQFYRAEHSIYGRCPCCGEPFRLSEAKLMYGKQPPRDALSRLEQAKARLIERNAQLEERIEEIEAEHEGDLADHDAKWEDRVDREVEKGLEKAKRDIRRKAILQSRRTTLGKVIERVAPWFSGSGHHPGDVRPVFDPLDFVVFDGLYTGEVTDVIFVEFKTGKSKLTEIQRSIRNAVTKKRVHFKEQRMTHATMEKLACGKMERSAAALETLPPFNGA